MNNQKQTFEPFTNDELYTIIKETKRGFAPKSVLDIQNKRPSDDQLILLFTSKLQTSHVLLALRHLNVENGKDVYKEYIISSNDMKEAPQPNGN